MSNQERLRTQMLELRVRARELTEQLEELTAELEANTAEQQRIRQLLITDSRTSLRLQSAAPPASSRGAIARMGAFTMGELETELGWKRARVKKLLDAMLCEKPPSLVRDGFVLGHPRFRYVGSPIEEVDDRAAAELEAVREWAMGQTTTFTPGECAAAVDVPRATALRHLRAIEQVGGVVDEGPTTDMPIFRVTGVKVPDSAPQLRVVRDEPLSKIPQIQELLAAAQQAGCDVTQSNGHFAIEALDGTNVIIASKVMGPARLREDKAKLRRIGVNV